MDRGHGGRGPFSLTEEDDDEDLLTDEDAMSQDKEEQQLWPDMCSPCRPFFKYHGPRPDQGSPGAMAICHVVVAEKDEGESKRGGWGVGPVLVTKVDKPQMIEEANAVRDSESDPTNEEDGFSHPKVREGGREKISTVIAQKC
jgi:hypothetical protein